MFAEMVDEHHDLEPQGFHKVEYLWPLTIKAEFEAESPDHPVPRPIPSFVLGVEWPHGIVPQITSISDSYGILGASWPGF